MRTVPEVRDARRLTRPAGLVTLAGRGAAYMEVAIKTGGGLAFAHDGRLRLLGTGNQGLLAGAYARVQLSDGTSYTTAGGDARLDGDTLVITAAPPGQTVRPDGQVRLTWRVTPTVDGLALSLAVTNAGPGTLSVERFDVLVAPTGWGSALHAELEVSQTGWQSWSYACPLQPIAGHTRPNHPTIAAPMLPPGEADALRSPWVLQLAAPGRPGLVVGFTAARSQLGLLTVAPGTGSGHSLTASSYPEGQRLAPGESLTSEPLRLFIGVPDALSAYAAAAAADMGATPPAGAPTGWCSWYDFFTEIDEAAMVRNLDVLVTERQRLPVEVVQLDDGYQTAIGDWLSLNADFPSGMRPLTDRIHAKGFQAGIWLAPFIVAEDSQVAREHPAWVLRDAQGDPVAAIENWGRACWALDLTHPGVLGWLREVFETLVGEWGFDYLKIDFIYAGALRGIRHEPGISSVAAYRRGLALIRELAGERFVLGCGAPFLPSLGLVDGMRVGPDTAPDWDHLDPQGSSPSLKNAIRSTLAHHWMHGRWWVNDPDCLIVRAHNTRLTEAQVQTWATVVSLSGGMVLLSDDLSKLEPERAAILARALPPLGLAARPLGPYTDGLPARLALPTPRGPYLAALFNWQDAPASLTFDPAVWPEAPVGLCWLLDLWSGEVFGPLAGPLTLGETPAHGVRLLAITPAQPHPHLIGSTLTLAGGAIEVVSETWANGTLSIALRCPGEHVGELVIATPGGVLRHAVQLIDATTIHLAV